MPTPNAILNRLLENEVAFVLVGGLAAVAYGVSTMTQDIDVCVDFEPDNLGKILKALEGIHPRVRAGGGLIPLEEYEPMRLAELGNIYVRTDLGELDLLGRVSGIGGYQDVKARAVSIELFGRSCPILSLDALIQAKEAMDRRKDMQVALELRAIREKLRNPG
ncbi:MAG TPA: hypothetical protein VLJ37_10135 [bacterium]|nr:hypothetical protein [bacterium]